MKEAIGQMYWIIIAAVCIIIGLAGGIFSAYNFWDSFTNDRPEEKKKGVTGIIVTVVALLLVLAIGGIMWGVMQGYINGIPTGQLS